MKPVVFGLSGPALTTDEASFFKTCRPAGFILFRRNIVDRTQLRALTDDLRAIHGDADVPILIDQEGGRVARMGSPIWPHFPAAAAFDALYERAPISALEAVRVNARAIALTLAEVGINVAVAPVLDVRCTGTHDAIGDRSFGSDPVRVASLGAAMIDGLRFAGVTGVIKHIPGQGRATEDTHHHMPVVDASDAELARDLIPFQRLRDAPMALTGHVVFRVWDADRSATMSPVVISDIIRGRIGFDGLLLSDDLDMAALSGDVASRARACLAAGCDIALHCSGRIADMAAIACDLPNITEAALTRLMAARPPRTRPDDVNAIPALIAKRDALLALA